MTAASNSFKPIPKMEIKCLLSGTLLLLLSCPINGQSQQPPPSSFLPNLFSSIQATLGNFNRFSYIPRPVGPFPVTGYRPGDVNFAVPHPFIQPIPQQPAVQFTRKRQNVPLPTSPPMREEVRQPIPPNLSSASDTGVPPQKYPAAPPDNRHFHNVRFAQSPPPPSSVSPSENVRKEIPVEKFHKPVFIDPAFGSNNIRKTIAPASVPFSSSDNGHVRHKNLHGQYSSETLVVNAKHHNVSNHPAQSTRIPHYVNKVRRPFDNFKPIPPHRKTFSSEKPILPQITETHSEPPEVPNLVNFQDENTPVISPTVEADAALQQSDSMSHSVYVKPPEQPVTRQSVLKEEEEVTDVEPNMLSSSSPVPEEVAQSFTQKPEKPAEASSVSATSELVGENLQTTTMAELPLPPDEKHLSSEDVFPTLKSFIPLSDVERFDGNPTLSRFALGDNKVLTGTPEEILTLKLSDAINNFGFELYHKMQESKNLFFSPVSLSAALAIVLEGSSNMTALQLMNGLHFPESNIRPDEVKSGFKRLMKSLKSKRSDYQFENANLLLLQNKFFFRSEFSNTVYRHYKPLLGSVDFATNGLNIKRSVNDWVKRRTHGKIDEFLTEQLPPETVFAVLNAVYFRGQWQQPFEPTLTGPALFYNNGKDPIEITMMKQIGTFPLGYSDNLNAHVIELPYEGEQTSMVILLPEKRDGIYQLKSKLNYQELYVILSTIEFQFVHLSLPRFSLRSRYDMEDVLKEMGMKDVFIPGKANFGRMTNVTGLYLSKVSHEGVIDVDEKGTEAAASTGGFIVPLSVPRKVIVNHPFFFIIRNRNNGAILFIGQFDAFDS